MAASLDASTCSDHATALADVRRCMRESDKTVLVRIENGQLQRSDSSGCWTNCQVGVRTFFRAVIRERGLFVAVGGSYFDERGVIVTSANGITWTRRSSGIKQNLYSVTFGNGAFVAVGDAGAIYKSTDGVAWKAQRSGTDILLASVTAGNNMFVAGGESGALLTSTNGVNWVSGNIGTPIYVGKLTFRNGEFRINDGNATFTSVSGMTWNRAGLQLAAE
jgi:photosystem II stability/assembly factor-like uncharacterized protein